MIRFTCKMKAQQLPGVSTIKRQRRELSEARETRTGNKLTAVLVSVAPEHVDLHTTVLRGEPCDILCQVLRELGHPPYMAARCQSQPTAERVIKKLRQDFIVGSER